MVLLIDACYYGGALRSMRSSLHLRQSDVARILGIDVREYVAYERGKKCMSDAVLQKIIHHAFVGLCTRYALGHPKNKLVYKKQDY